MDLFYCSRREEYSLVFFHKFEGIMISFLEDQYKGGRK
jgi:hypothetical protein